MAVAGRQRKCADTFGTSCETARIAPLHISLGELEALGMPAESIGRSGNQALPMKLLNEMVN